MPDSEEFLDPYLDSETGILRNLVGARTKESLEDAEGSLSFTRLVQLMTALPSQQATSPNCAQSTVTCSRTSTSGPGRSAPSTSARTSRAPSSSSVRDDRAGLGLRRRGTARRRQPPRPGPAALHRPARVPLRPGQLH